MTTEQKALIEKLDSTTYALADLATLLEDIIEPLANLTTLLEASFETHPEIEADPLAGHPELPLATTDQP